MRISIRRIVQLGILLTLCNVALAQTIEFDSLTGRDGFHALYKGRVEFNDRISGEFTRPKGVSGKVPVMVLMHGSAGNSEISTGTWSKFFLNMGIATFVVDSFTARGIKSTSQDQSVLSDAGSAVDGLKALQVVATIPGVDVERIGITGFSRGGIAAINTSLPAVMSKVLGADSKLKYALHVSFYPACTRFGTTTGQPILMLMGDQDDNHPMRVCNTFVEKLKNRGANLTFVVYPGATHAFDLDRKAAYLPKVQAWKDCAKDRKEDLDTLDFMIDDSVVSVKDYLAYSVSCRTNGIHVGPDRFGASDSRKQVTDFVRKNFAM